MGGQQKINAHENFAFAGNKQHTHEATECTLDVASVAMTSAAGSSRSSASSMDSISKQSRSDEHPLVSRPSTDAHHATELSLPHEIWATVARFLTDCRLNHESFRDWQTLRHVCTLTRAGVDSVEMCIDEKAFDRCTILASMTVPNSVTTISESAFRGCTSLTSVTIPDSVTTIGDRAFDGCDKLSRL